MSLIKRLAALAIPLALAILIGCGGGGSSTNRGTSPNALTRQNVKEGFGLTLMALAQSGMGPIGAGAGTSGGTNGGGGGVPYVGAFVHSFLPGPGGPLARVKATRGDVGTSGGTTGTTTSGGGGETPEIYFDEYLGLWVEWSWSDNEYSTLLFEDEAKTQPAGSFHTTYTETSFTSTFEITAGQFKGAHGRYVSTYTDEGGFASETTYDNTWPGYGHDEGTATWSETGSQWHHRGDLEDGSWYESDGAFTVAGGGHSSGSDSRGYRYDFTYNPDGSGSGRVEGPENGLPCTITWRADGFTRIVWADGSVEEFDPNDWIGGGTTGSGTGGDANTGTVTGTGGVGTSGTGEG